MKKLNLSPKAKQEWLKLQREIDEYKTAKENLYKDSDYRSRRWKNERYNDYLRKIENREDRIKLIKETGLSVSERTMLAKRIYNRSGIKVPQLLDEIWQKKP